MGAVSSPDPEPTVRPVDYKGEPLNSERGPGLGCFWIQLGLLVFSIVLTPLSVVWGWPSVISAALLFLTIFLLLFAGQTVIFLLRLVAADRRDGRRRPLGSAPHSGRARGPGGHRGRRGGRRPGRPGRRRVHLSRRARIAATDRFQACQEDGRAVPILATYFSVRRGRDPFFKFFMKTLFPRQVKEYEEKFGIRFVGWFNVAHGWDFDNVIMFDLPDYATLDKLEADEATRALGHRAGEWIFERHHSMFLRERLGPDLEYHG